MSVRTIRSTQQKHDDEQQKWPGRWPKPIRRFTTRSGTRLERQDSRLELIASENFTSEAVLEATGSVFTNKYAEGYPGKRYYGGCEYADVVENLARERAKKLFGAEYVNVQPHSGSQANQAAYAAVLSPATRSWG